MNPGAEERVRFWFSNAPLAMMALHKVAPNGDYSNLVVIVADMRDDIARMLTEAVGEVEGADVAAHEAKMVQKGEIPTGILVFELPVAKSLFEVVDHPGIAENLARVPSPRHVRAVVISSGAAMLMHPPIVALPSSGVS